MQIKSFVSFPEYIPFAGITVALWRREEIISFDEKIKKVIPNPSYVCELKIDGLSVSLIYKNGKLVRAATRGDGVVGEDITHNAKTIKDIPLTLKKDIDIEVRGEIYMSKKSLEKVNIERLRNGEKPLQNARNGAAGSIRQLDSKIAAKRGLDVWIYHLPNPLDYGIHTHYEALEYMSKLYPYYIVKNMHQLFLQITKEGARNSADSLENMQNDIDMLIESVYRDRIERANFHRNFLQFGIMLYLMVMLVQYLLGRETYLKLLDQGFVPILLHVALIVNTYFLLKGEKYYNENVGAE